MLSLAYYYYLVVKGYPLLCSVAVEGSDLPALPQSQFPREVDFACPLYPLLFIYISLGIIYNYQ